MRILWPFFFLLFLNINSSFGQKKSKFTFQPIFSTSPETGLSIGGIGFYRNKQTTILGLSNYSFNKQLNLLIIPTIFFIDGKYLLKSKINYTKIRNKFWGVGNNSTKENQEIIHHDVINIEIDPYKKLRPNLYVGVNYQLYIISNLTSQNQSTFNLNNYLSSGLGPSILYDSRKNRINPNNGWYLTFKSTYYFKELASNIEFNQHNLDIRHYLKLHPKTNHILAFQATVKLSSTNTPWNNLAQLGGIQLRGYFKGRFRDQNLFTLQSEYRSPLLFWRLSTVAFVGAGYVSKNLKTNKLHPSLGTGLRVMLDKKDRLNLRFDYAIGANNNNGFYFGIKESF